MGRRTPETENDLVVRAVTIPVGAPDCGWDALRPALHAAWRLSTGLANWCVHRLYGLDTPNERKTPEAVAKWYGYGDAGKNYAAWGEWAGAMASAQCVIRGVQRKYGQVRFKVMVRHDQRVLGYRYPFPFPVHNQNWRTDYAPGGFPLVTLALPGLGTVTLRMKRSAEYRRQLAMFRQLHDGTAKKGEAALYQNRKGELLLKMVGRFPRRERGEATNVCFLHTDPAALLVAEVNGRSVTITNGDHLRRAMAVIRETSDRHRRFLQRISEDKKREVRMDRRQRANLNKKVDERCAKQRARIDTAVKQIAAQVARFCQRQGVGLIAYDDCVKTFLPDGFAWHAIKERIVRMFVGEMKGEWVDGHYTHLNSDEEKVEWLNRARATVAAGRKAVANANRNGSHPAVTPPTSADSRCRQPKGRSPGSARRSVT